MSKKYGIVVFFEPDYATGAIKEMGRTESLDSIHALNVYAETPNPASQLLLFNTVQEKKQVEDQLLKDIKDRKWLDELFNCI